MQLTDIVFDSDYFNISLKIDNKHIIEIHSIFVDYCVIPDDIDSESDIKYIKSSVSKIVKFLDNEKEILSLISDKRYDTIRHKLKEHREDIHFPF